MMVEGDGFVYNITKAELMGGQYDLTNGADSLKFMLVSAHTPDIDAHTGYASVSGDEYGAGSGYTVGGDVVGGQAVTKDDTNDRGQFDATDQTFAALGPLSPAQPTHTILYDDTHAAKLLILYFELGTTPTNGGNYTLAFNVNGILLLV